MPENKYSLSRFLPELTRHEIERVKTKVRQRLENDVKAGKITVDQMEESWSKILKTINRK